MALIESISKKNLPVPFTSFLGKVGEKLIGESKEVLDWF